MELVIRLKGGKGSGNWGHRGRLGKVGGSNPGRMTSTSKVNLDYFAHGPGKDLLDPEYYNELVDVIHKTGITSAMVKGLKGIHVGDAESDPEWSGMEGSAAFYDNDGGIYLRDDNTYCWDMYLSHEIGHHLESRIFEFGTSPPAQGMLSAFNEASKLKGKELWELGLREYSLTSLNEFVAESMMVYSTGHDSDKKNLDKFIQDSFRKWIVDNPKNLIGYTPEVADDVTLDWIFNLADYE